MYWRWVGANFSNIELAFVTSSILNLDISRYFKEEHSENVFSILVTIDVSKSDKFNDTQFLKFMKKQVKDIVKQEFDKYQKKCNINKDYQDLVTLNNRSKMKSGSTSDINSNPMYKYIEELKAIKQLLNQSEESLKSEIQNLSSSNKSCFEKMLQYFENF